MLNNPEGHVASFFQRDFYPGLGCVHGKWGRAHLCPTFMLVDFCSLEQKWAPGLERGPSGLQSGCVGCSLSREGWVLRNTEWEDRELLV